jgi:PAS domain-containing protein
MHKNEKGLNFKPAIEELHAENSNRPSGTVKDSEPDDKISGSNSKTSSADFFVTERLIQNEKRFRTVFEAAPLGIAIADPDGYFIETNNAFHQLLGYDPQEVKELNRMSKYCFPAATASTAAPQRSCSEAAMDLFKNPSI